MIATFLLLAVVYAGRPLTDALQELERKGLRLVYSDDVVTAAMIVRAEPGSTKPRAILDELLAPHSLRAVAGPRETLLIVRVEREERARTEGPMPIALAEIVVTPSRFSILGDEPESRQFLSREEVRRVPHFSDDLYRAIIRVPGMTAGDYTARPNIRGGAENEMAVLVDGAEIFDPFHLKDLFRAFSTIDSEAVGSVDVLTGGFPSEYGGRMSGVVDVLTLSPTERRTEIGISLLNTRILSQGTFRGGEWLLSFRRGYLREMLELIDDSNQLDPHYYDLLGKIQRTIGGSSVVSAHVLLAQDDLSVREQFENANAQYSDRYVWINLRSAPSPQLFVQSVASYGRHARTRRGSYAGGDQILETGQADDDRNATILSTKNDATYHLSPTHLIKGGATIRRVSARYRYEARSQIVFAPVITGGRPPEQHRMASLDLHGTELAMYLADRVRVGERLVAEAGVRVETESHTPDGLHINPRLNVAWAPSSGTAVRAAWGRVAQPHHIYELPVEDGQLEFLAAERAEHRVLGVDQALPRGASARLEIYDKRFTHPRPRYENIFNRVVLFPELRYDRVRIEPDGGRARGAELLVRSKSDLLFSGWFSYALGEVVDWIDGREVPRSWDQQHALSFSANYRRGDAWNFNLAGTLHSGWPTTPIDITVQNNRILAEAGEINSDRLPAYRRYDFRVSRHVKTRRGAGGVFIELFNVFNHKNVVRVRGFDFSDLGDVTPRHEGPIGVIPSFGVTWQF